MNRTIAESALKALRHIRLPRNSVLRLRAALAMRQCRQVIRSQQA